MNRQDLIKKIAEDVQITQKTAASALNAVIGGISDAMANKEKVTLIGFGTFSVNHRKAGTGKNPRTGETIKIAARDVPVFKASKKLKEDIS